MSKIQYYVKQLVYKHTYIIFFFRNSISAEHITGDHSSGRCINGINDFFMHFSKTCLESISAMGIQRCREYLKSYDQAICLPRIASR